MTTELAKAARELLALEKQALAGKLDDPTTERWRACLELVFGEENSGSGRRSFRIPAATPAWVTFRKGTFACDVLEVSRLGLTLAGDVFRDAAPEETLELARVTVGGVEKTLGLTCTLVRIDTRRPVPVAGVLIVRDGSGERTPFFADVYYPLYLRYLDDLAGGRRTRTSAPPA